MRWFDLMRLVQLFSFALLQSYQKLVFVNCPNNDPPGLGQRVSWFASWWVVLRAREECVEVEVIFLF